MHTGLSLKGRSRICHNPGLDAEEQVISIQSLQRLVVSDQPFTCSARHNCKVNGIGRSASSYLPLLRPVMAVPKARPKATPRKEESTYGLSFTNWSRVPPSCCPRLPFLAPNGARMIWLHYKSHLKVLLIVQFGICLTVLTLPEYDASFSTEPLSRMCLGEETFSLICARSPS